jgi:hypothetical protein
VSNTSLQALTLLNDPMLLEAAQALGATVAKADGTPAAKVDGLIRRCLARPAGDDEVKVLTTFYDAVPGDAAAKWTAVARAVLNLDEFVTKE